MEKASERLKALGITLPPAPKPVAAYIPWVRHHDTLILSGQLPTKDGKLMYAGQVVETGSVRQVLNDPQHPYTRGLLESVPSLERRGRRLIPIPGTVPSSTAWPDGCRFAERCPLNGPGCEEAQSLVEEGGTGRTVRCWRSEAMHEHDEEGP